MYFLLLNVALAEAPHLQGYGELRFLAFPTGLNRWQTVERLRPSLRWDVNEFFSIKSTLDLSLFQGRDEFEERISIIRSPIELAVPPNINGAYYSLEDICTLCGWDVEFKRPHPWQIQLARIHMDITLDMIDIRLGRQSIEWSEMFLFNNSDPLPQNLIQTPWQERQGMDALRLQFPIGTHWDMDIAISRSTDLVSLETLSPQKLSLRARTFWGHGESKNKSELSFISHITDDTQIFAFSARGEHLVGWRTEWVYHHTDQPFLHASIATDYTFDIHNGMLLYLQLTHDSSGAIPELYAWNKRDWGIAIQDCPALNLQVPELGSDIRHTLGKWYLIGNASHTFEEQLQLRYATLLNLIDHTGLHMLYLAWHHDYFSMHLALLKGYGEKGEFASDLGIGQTSLLGSELSDIIPSWKWMSWFRFQY